MGCAKTGKRRHHVDAAGIAASTREGIGGISGVVN